MLLCACGGRSLWRFKALDPLKLESKVVAMNHPMWKLETELGSSTKAVGSLNRP